jgi:hypothetical protein
MNPTQGQFQILGFAILFCVVLIAVFGTAMNSFVGEKGLLIKTEFVKDTTALERLVENKREDLKTALIVDTIGFIPIYFLLFTLLIWFLAQQGNSISKYAAIASGIFAVATIFFDLSENMNLYKCLDGDFRGFESISSAAIGKWICFFITSAILSSAFWQPNWYLIIASLFLLGATGGLVSLAAQKYTFIQYSTVPIILGTLIVGIGFTFFSVNAEKVFSAK